MNVASLIELVSGSSKASPSGVTPQASPSALPTFQASLLAAQTATSARVLNVGEVEGKSEPGSNSERSTKSTSESEKPQDDLLDTSTPQSLLPAHPTLAGQQPILQSGSPEPPAANNTTPAEAGFDTEQDKQTAPLAVETNTPATIANSTPALIVAAAASPVLAITAQPLGTAHVPASKTISATTAISAKRPSAVTGRKDSTLTAQTSAPVINVTVPVATFTPAVQPVLVSVAPSAGTTPVPTASTKTADLATTSETAPAVVLPSDTGTPFADQLQQQELDLPIPQTPAAPSEGAPLKPTVGLEGAETSVANALPVAPAAIHATTAIAPPSTAIAQSTATAQPSAATAQPSSAPSPAAPSPSGQDPLQVAPAAVVSQAVITPFLTPSVLPIAAGKTGVVPAGGKVNGPTAPRLNEQASIAANAAAAAKPAVHAAAATSSTSGDGQGSSQQSDQTQPGSSVHGLAENASTVSNPNQTVTVADHTSAILSPQQAPPNAATNTPNPGNQAAASANVAASVADTGSVPVANVHQASEINSARLIQSVGQSEMRVGIRSNEFGDISIRTSSARDVVSAQISLDHDELARTLINHLPEMQEKFGGTQPIQVRIDLNGQSAGQPTGQGQQNAGGAPYNSSGNAPQGQQTRPGGGSYGAVAEPRSSTTGSHSGHYGAADRLDVTA